MRNNKRFLGAAMAVGLLASGAYALTASNTFSDAANQSGTGSETITGYEVSNVHYVLDATDVTKYSAVTFDLDGTAGDVRAKVLGSATAYSTCTETTGTGWTCPITNTVAESDSLTVIAVQ